MTTVNGLRVTNARPLIDGVDIPLRELPSFEYDEARQPARVVYDTIECSGSGIITAVGGYSIASRSGELPRKRKKRAKRAWGRMYEWFQAANSQLARKP